MEKITVNQLKICDLLNRTKVAKKYGFYLRKGNKMIKEI